ncbi:MAG: peptidoglycan recognition family protein [Armatimonadota bacterium]
MFRTVSMPSPNHSDRGGVTVDTIMLHSTGSTARSALEWLCNPNSKVSAHYVIGKDGTVYKLVPTSRSAWHAGKCRVKNANSRSIGIEMEQLPGDEWTSAQRDTLLRLIRVLSRAIPSVKYLVGHREWNKMKTDPYTDMNELRKITGLEKL